MFFQPNLIPMIKWQFFVLPILEAIRNSLSECFFPSKFMKLHNWLEYRKNEFIRFPPILQTLSRVIHIMTLRTTGMKKRKTKSFEKGFQAMNWSIFFQIQFDCIIHFQKRSMQRFYNMGKFKHNNFTIVTFPFSLKPIGMMIP